MTKKKNPPVEGEPAVPVEVPADGGGVLEVVARKPDASHGALHQLLLEGEKISHELLDEIEKRCDVGDVKFLVAFCRHLLDSQEA